MYRKMNEENLNARSKREYKAISDEIRCDIAVRLKKLRNDHRFKKEYVAEKIGCSVDTINGYEAGTQDFGSKKDNIKGMNINTLLGFVKLYNVSADYLLCLSDVQCPDIEYQGATRRF